MIKFPRSRQHAFTIVELLIVVVVIAILAAITIVAYNGISGRAKDSAVRSAAEQVAKKIATYTLTNNDTYPATLAAAGVTNDATTYQYTTNTAASPQNFCLTATASGTTVHIAGSGTSMNQIVPGPCPGHTGTAPTTLADGSSCPAGYILVPGNSLFNTQSFCTMKYEAKIQGNDIGTTAYSASMVAESRASGTPWVNISQDQAKAEATALGAGYHLMTEAEWMTIAANVLSVPSNWSGGAVGSGYIYSGHNDGAPNNALAADTNDANGYAGETNTGGNQRRTLTLTNGQVIWDMAGNVFESTDATISGGSQPGQKSDVAYTWREWTNPSITLNGLPNLHTPDVISTQAAGWSSAQGIGQLFAYYNEPTTRAYMYGGRWNDAAYSGILALHMANTTATGVTSAGFRVSRS